VVSSFDTLRDDAKERLNPRSEKEKTRDAFRAASNSSYAALKALSGGDKEGAKAAAADAASWLSKIVNDPSSSKRDIQKAKRSAAQYSGELGSGYDLNINKAEASLTDTNSILSKILLVLEGKSVTKAAPSKATITKGGKTYSVADLVKESSIPGTGSITIKGKTYSTADLAAAQSKSGSGSITVGGKTYSIPAVKDATKQVDPAMSEVNKYEALLAGSTEDKLSELEKTKIAVSEVMMSGGKDFATSFLDSFEKALPLLQKTISDGIKEGTGNAPESTGTDAEQKGAIGVDIKINNDMFYAAVTDSVVTSLTQA